MIADGFHKVQNQLLASAGVAPLDRLRTLIAGGCPVAAALEEVCLRLPPDIPGRPYRVDPEAGAHPWNLVRFLVRCLREGIVTLAQAVELLLGRRVHPWSLAWGEYQGTWAEALEWGEALGLPEACIAQLREQGDPSLLQVYPGCRGDLHLEWIPENLKVRALCLRDCPRLTGIGPGFESEGILDLTNCGLLEGLPEGLRVQHHLRVRGCSSFAWLPSAFTCERLVLEDLPSLERLDLPGNFLGALLAEDCPALTVFRAWSHQLKDLLLIRCPIRQLPPGLAVEGIVTLTSLPITTLPPGLQVGGDCRLQDLPDCRAFGEGTRIGGDLTLAGLPRLWSLPADLAVGGALIVERDRDPGTVPAHLRDRVVIGEA
jgi:hypothetical protein